MLLTRPSVPEDIPAQRLLWQLAFGDDGAYVDNFYKTYYRPERVLVLEEDGQIRSMTAWFDTTFVAGFGEYRAAYLYAVATHPNCRGRGLAARLLSDADRYFDSLGIPSVTTVPAEASLHNFFGANGFRECFVLQEHQLTVEEGGPTTTDLSVHPASPQEYGSVRERLLAGTAHISYPPDALAYQSGCCTLGSGGLFVGQTAQGQSICLCAEGDNHGLMIVKEWLGSVPPSTVPLCLKQLLPAQQYKVRFPVSSFDRTTNIWKFAMLKWLNPNLASSWDWSSTAYLGLAFD